MTEPTIDVNPILQLIPEAIRNQITTVCTTVIALATLATTYLALHGTAAKIVGGILAVGEVVLGAVQHGTVTPAHHVAVDKRRLTGPAIVTTIKPRSPATPLGITTPPKDIAPTIAVTPLDPARTTVVTTDPVTGEVSTSLLPIAGSDEDTLPPLDTNPLDTD